MLEYFRGSHYIDLYIEKSYNVLLCKNVKSPVKASNLAIMSASL